MKTFMRVVGFKLPLSFSVAAQQLSSSENTNQLWVRTSLQIKLLDITCEYQR